MPMREDQRRDTIGRGVAFLGGKVVRRLHCRYKSSCLHETLAPEFASGGPHGPVSPCCALGKRSAQPSCAMAEASVGQARQGRNEVRGRSPQTRGPKGDATM